MQNICFPRRRSIVALFSLLLLIGTILYFAFHRSASPTRSSITVEEKANNLLTSAATDKESMNYSVCVDPGHGGSDVGAEYAGLKESQINLSVSKFLQKDLENMGYTVYLTRIDDSFVEKRSRAEFCNNKNASILLSIHHNSYEEDGNVDYSTALYYKDSDQRLAGYILNSTSLALSLENKGISRFDNSLLWIAKMPATLSEAFFISNKNKQLSIKSNDYLLEAEAQALALGVKNYFESPNGAALTVDNNSLSISRQE